MLGDDSIQVKVFVEGGRGKRAGANVLHLGLCLLGVCFLRLLEGLLEGVKLLCLHARQRA